VVNKMNKLNLPFIEKYRPQTFDEFIGVDKEQIKEMIKRKEDFTHLLFSSKTPGTGKTSLALLIIKELGADHLIINSSDDRKIEVIREKVKSFAKTLSSVPGVPKIIFLDEADGMLTTSQNALRNIMEKFINNCRFILTCNNEEKIIDPIKSRCQTINFKYPPKDQLIKRLKFIIENEKIECDDVEKIINTLIKFHYPSIRDCLMALQFLSMSKKKITTEMIEEKNFKLETEVYELIKKGKYDEARRFWIEWGMNPEQLNKELFDFIEKDTELSEEKRQKALLLLGEVNYKQSVGADKEIQLYCGAIQLSKIL